MTLTVVAYNLRMKRFPKSLTRFFSPLTITLLINLSSCSNSGLITPPSDSLGNSLNSIAAEQNPRLSYNGRYLVFASDRHRQRSIFLYDLQSRRLLPLPGLNQPGSIQDEPDISADGRYIVYLSEQEGKTDIFVYDRQSFQTENITKNILAQVRQPTISGDGRLIAFESNRTGRWNIEIFDRGLTQPLSLPPNSKSGSDTPLKN